MKFALAIVAVLALSVSASACPVAVQAFAAPACSASVVQSFAVPQVAVQAFVPQIAVQSFAVVPQAVQVQSAVSVLSVPVQPVCHGCGGRVRVLGLGGGRSVSRSRAVVRSR